MPSFKAFVPQYEAEGHPPPVVRTSAETGTAAPTGCVHAEFAYRWACVLDAPCIAAKKANARHWAAATQPEVHVALPAIDTGSVPRDVAPVAGAANDGAYTACACGVPCCACAAARTASVVIASTPRTNRARATRFKSKSSIVKSGPALFRPGEAAIERCARGLARGFTVDRNSLRRTA